MSIFRAYDVRGVYPTELNAKVAYNIAQAYFQLVPGTHFLIGQDVREANVEMFNAFAAVAKELDKQLESLGQTTTSMFNFALGKYPYDGGIMLTASHNPANYGGIKLMQKGVLPVDSSELAGIYDKLPAAPAEMEALVEVKTVDYLEAYVTHILSFIDSQKLKPMRIVVDAGNGMAGKVVPAIFKQFPQVELIPMYFEPVPDYPHHEANPAIPDNTKALAAKVVDVNADLGIAYDGDADRCFLVDDKGGYIEAPHLLALIADIVLGKYPGDKIVNDYRHILAVSQVAAKHNAQIVYSPAGHSNLRHVMESSEAVYGSESSGHYYFRDCYYAGNADIPVLLVLEYLSTKGLQLSEAVADLRQEFFTTGERNFVFKTGSPQQILAHLEQKITHTAASYPDGLVLSAEGWRMNVRASNTEAKLRVVVEGNSQLQIEEVLIRIYEELSALGIYEDNAADPASLHQTFSALLHNLWFTWNPHHILPVIDVYGDGWRRNSPPGQFSSTYAKNRFDEILMAKSWEVIQNKRLLDQYLARDKTWFNQVFAAQSPAIYQRLLKHPIAYFCLEYGLVDWLQIYSGGLGILAGDVLKQSSDSGIPMVGVGIFYHKGFFHQDFDNTGLQVETYIDQNPLDYPITPVVDVHGKPIQISVEIMDHEVWVKAWQVTLGMTKLYLLDTDFERNPQWEDRMITGHLYGGDRDTRIRQEIVLGIGGPRLLEALEIEPGLYHMNEGHSGFLVIELARRYIEDKGLSFEDAVKKADAALVFTNHTLKQAGNDIFTAELMHKYFDTYLDNLHTDFDHVFALGKDDDYAHGDFSMTLLGMRNAAKSNAVSKLHGVAATKMWPNYKLAAVTNGVHMPTWVAPEIHELLDNHVSELWHEPSAETDWGKINSIPDAELWAAHKKRKYKLINSLNVELNLNLNPEALTIAWARRLAEYKRADLIMEDLERLHAIVSAQDRPIQILLSGKAHPQDPLGKQILQQMWHELSDPRFHNKIALIPGYNWQLARRMVSGADVWLNTPHRYEEASGTSGMKAAANGLLQLTTLDGWTDEVNWDGIGWAISEEDPGKSLYSLLETEVVPLYFNRGDKDYSSEWLARMKHSMQTVLFNYSSQRMLHDYLMELYLPILEKL